jgi:UDP:flavonoid glycosyltransferase YjiC (YdhE family)
MSKSFLFVLWAGGGNVPPQLVLAGRLAAQGHEVRVLAPQVLRQRIEAAGLLFEPYREAPEHDEAVRERSLIRDFEHRTPIGAASAARDHLLAGMAGPIAADVRAVLRDRKIDLVASDCFLFGGLFAAEAAGVPRVMLVHTVYPFPGQGRPPFGFGWAPKAGPAGAVRDAIGGELFRRLYEGPLLPRLNDVRAGLGLAPIGSMSALIEGLDGVAVLTSRAFDFPGAVPANVRYVGAQLEGSSSTWSPPWPTEDIRPLVVVAFSTTYQAHEDVLARTVEAIGDLPVKAVVSTGSFELNAVPPNVHAASYVPHDRLMPLVDVVVTHAGLGTVHAALSHGSPLVCLPMGRDQLDNAARVVARGAGIRLAPKASPAKIRAAVQRVLDDGRFAAAARRLQTAMALDDSATTGPNLLVALAEGGSAARPGARSGLSLEGVAPSGVR